MSKKRKKKNNRMRYSKVIFLRFLKVFDKSKTINIDDDKALRRSYYIILKNPVIMKQYADFIIYDYKKKAKMPSTVN